MKRVRNRWLMLLRVIFLIGSVYILLRVVDFKLVFVRMREIPAAVLFLLVLIALVRTWLTGERWRLASPDSSCQLSRWKYFKLTMMTAPFSLIMPGALGGDFARMALTMKEVKKRRVDNLIAIVVDRFIGLLSMTLMGGVSLFFMSDIPDKRIFYFIFGGLFLVYAVGVLVVGNPHVLRLLDTLFLHCGKIGERLAHALGTWRQALIFFKGNFPQLVKAWVLCIPIHGLAFVRFYILSLCLGVDISFFDVCLILSLVWVITAVPVTVSGAGVRELSMIYFLSLYGVEAEPAAALSVYTYVVATILGLIGLGFLFFGKKRSDVGGAEWRAE